MKVLGISALFHDAAAAVVVDGRVVAAAQEERFSGIKHDPALPQQAIAWCLRAAEIEPGSLDAVAFYEKPVSTYARIMRSAAHAAPGGFSQLRQAVPVWLRRKLWVEYHVEAILRSLGHDLPGRLRYSEHHLSHAASAFHPSPFDAAAILTVDGVGEWATTTISHGTPTGVVPLRQLVYPHSLGLLYSAFTQYCGFRINGGEYKLMGLAPYGEPVYRDRILEHVLDLRPDGSFRVDPAVAGWIRGRRMTNRRFERLFGGPPRRPSEPLEPRHADLAASVQVVTEEAVLALAEEAARLTGEEHLCLAGGVALNAVANGRLRREGPFADLWVQPAAGDAGGALGAALAVHVADGGRRPAGATGRDLMEGCLLGPTITEQDLQREALDRPVRLEALDPADRAGRLADLLADGAIVGVVDGPMEFGPRALGNRSILADPRRADVVARLNGGVKRREAFRPFAPAVLAERVDRWFDVDADLPYMTEVHPVHPDRRIEPAHEQRWPPEARLATPRSEIPAVTHVDGSARLQTVDADRHPRFHQVLVAFEDRTGCPVLVNTSLNVRGRPMAGTAADALDLLATTDLDVLVVGDLLVTMADEGLASGAPGTVGATVGR